MLNDASKVGHVVRRDDAMARHMLKNWTPGRDKTGWTMRARTQRKKHSIVAAERDLIDCSQRRSEAKDLSPERWADLARDTVWWRSMCLEYARAQRD